MQSDLILKSKLIKRNEFQKYFSSLSEDEPEIVDFRNSPLFANNKRQSMVQWLVFLCEKLNFNTQTLFRSVIIFDSFISQLKQDILAQEKLNLIAVACLSLGTKLEEINCNYVSFFVEKVLNVPGCPSFTTKDLTKMEMEILKKLKYKTLYSTAVDFNEIFLGILKTFFDESPQSQLILQNVFLMSEQIMKQNILNEQYLTMTQSNFAYFCFNQAFLQLGFQNFIIVKEIAKILLSQFGYKSAFKNLQNFQKTEFEVPISPFSAL